MIVFFVVVLINILEAHASSTRHLMDLMDFICMLWLLSVVVVDSATLETVSITLWIAFSVTRVATNRIESIHFSWILIIPQEMMIKMKKKKMELFKFDANAGQSDKMKAAYKIIQALVRFSLTNTINILMIISLACGNLCIYCFDFVVFRLVSIVATLCVRVCECSAKFYYILSNSSRACVCVQ